MQMQTAEEILAKLDSRIMTKYGQYKRGIKSSYDELMELQEFRREAFGSKIELDFKSKPEGCQLVRF